MNFIKSVRFSGSDRQSKANEISFAIPSETKNVITVICGKNRTGKSYLLRKISRCIKNHNKKVESNILSNGSLINEEDIYVEIDDLTQPIPEHFLINNINELLKYSKSISVELDTRFKKGGPRDERPIYDDPIALKLCFDKLAGDFVKYQLEINKKKFDDEKWSNENEYRIEICKNNFSGKKLYRVNPTDELTVFFSRATGGQLFFSLNEALEKTNFSVFLVYDEKRVLDFQSWSEGQKVLFICLVIIKYLKIQILLFDELENHLHPEFISIFLEYLREKIPQCIITSHHPHIIFSTYIDKVWYLQIVNQESDLPSEIDKSPKNFKTNVAPYRTALALEKNFIKLSKTYDLFDSFDNNLLKLSSSTIADFNELLVEIFTNIFHYGIVSSNPKKKGDLQVEGLLKQINEKIDKHDKINILEIGAGKGRIMLDITKLKQKSYSEKVNWHLYEPVDIVFDELQKRIESFKISDNEDYNIELHREFPIDNKYDFIFIANVLHEITPNIVAHYFAKIPHILKDDGEVIIIELFPILLPERFSVPYKQNEIEALFRLLNWKVYSDNLNIKNSKINAYFSILTKTTRTNTNENEILKVIEKFWKNEISKNRCADYGGKSEFKSADETIKIMCELTTISSIASYFCGEWRLDVLP